MDVEVGPWLGYETEQECNFLALGLRSWVRSVRLLRSETLGIEG